MFKISDERLAEIVSWAASEEAECRDDDMPVSAEYYADVQSLIQSLRSPQPAGVRVTDKMIDIGVEHYSEGGCSGLSTFERREVVEGILHAALSALEPQQEEAVAEDGWRLPAADWLDEAAKYFERRPTDGEDAAFWANFANKQFCEGLAARLRSTPVQKVQESQTVSITDEMVERARHVHADTLDEQREKGRLNYIDAMRAALTAALAPS